MTEIFEWLVYWLTINLFTNYFMFTCNTSLLAQMDPYWFSRCTTVVVPAFEIWPKCMFQLTDPAEGGSHCDAQELREISLYYRRIWRQQHHCAEADRNAETVHGLHREWSRKQACHLYPTQVCHLLASQPQLLQLSSTLAVLCRDRHLIVTVKLNKQNYA